MEILALDSLYTTTLLFVLVGSLLLAKKLPPRNHVILRAILSAVGLFLYVVLASVIKGIVRDSDTPSLLAAYDVAVYTLCPILISFAIFQCFSTTRWTALFCGLTGYLFQNLGSTLGTMLSVSLSLDSLLPSNLPRLISSVAIPCIILILCYGSFVRKIVSENVLALERGWRILLVAALILLFNITYARLIGVLSETYAIAHIWITVLRMPQIALCLLTLIMEFDTLHTARLNAQNSSLQTLLNQRSQQYRTSKATIDAINMKFHDLRHLIVGHTVTDSPSFIDELKKKMSLYDTTISTGNEALDTVLTEMSLRCERERIPFNCMANGKLLDFMEPSDIYILFGNAIENAIEANLLLNVEELRDIHVNVRLRADLIVIHVENRCKPTPLVCQGGLPATTKADSESHGLGMRSMQLTAEKYGGMLSFEKSAETFELNVVFPFGGETNTEI